MQVPYEEHPLIHTRQNPSWDQFKQRASQVLRYDQDMQQVSSLAVHGTAGHSPLVMA